VVGKVPKALLPVDETERALVQIGNRSGGLVNEAGKIGAKAGMNNRVALANQTDGSTNVTEGNTGGRQEINVTHLRLLKLSV